ncbi:hypothetical protein BT96DRAFT_1044570 [Gymnopus androsaceus JB14]|uniref:Uncharacterized protein n=1 Tax=Gymnopus androsaceus JB14 TaxID=1447944 RepID=A0A6A4HBZ0_9AGAR|nr:hypothetical protein BT96DRAFT_1044570 [Gymnopus androsaceus JB14]
MLAIILQMKPEILEQTFPDGSKFQASDSYVRSFLHSSLEWSPRKATQAARKRPNDWEDQCERSEFRKAYVIKEKTTLPAEPLGKLRTRGTDCLMLLAADEKRAFTLMVSVTSKPGSSYLSKLYHQGLHGINPVRPPDLKLNM